MRVFCEYWRDGEMSNIDHDITFWVSDDLHIGSGVPEDDGEIAEAISEAVKDIANEYVGEVQGKIEPEGGNVTFDVVAREISVRAEVEVTKTKTFEKSSSV
jgi:hypothetical protein